MRKTQIVSVLSTPGWRRTLLLRRVLAGALVVLAGLVFFTQHNQPTVEVVVAARPVPAGSSIDRPALRVQNYPEGLAPEGALRGPEGIEAASGRIAATTLAAGEILTPQKLVGQESVSAIVAPAGGGADPQLPRHLVPVHLADDQVTRMLHHGDEVSVVTAADEPGSPEAVPRVIAPGALVILAAEGDPNAPRGGTGASLLLALPPAEADAVAAAALAMPLAVVVTGERARA